MIAQLRRSGHLLPRIAFRYHGQLWNAAEIGSALGVSGHTTRHYLDILSETFMIRQLPAWFENLGKRQVKSPKIFFRDSGIFHGLLGVRDENSLRLHPKLGASWEGYATEEILRALRPDEAYFWKVHGGAELDLLCFKNGQRIGFEIKFGDAPRLTASMRSALESLRLHRLEVIYPGTTAYPLGDTVSVWPLKQWVEIQQMPDKLAKYVKRVHPYQRRRTSIIG